MSATTTITAIEAHTQVTEGARKSSKERRVLRALKVGQVVRQGDIYLHRVPDDHPHGQELETRQLAEGTTQGARHLVESGARIYEGTTTPPGCDVPFLGPLVRARTRLLVSHPEHAEMDLPRGTYQVTHQQDLLTMQRVLD